MFCLPKKIELTRFNFNDLGEKPEVADILSKLPSNESIAVGEMKQFPVIIGHSGLDLEGDAKRENIKDTSVKV